MNNPVVVDYYSDVLCIWAWLAQSKLSTLNQQLSGKIHINHHYMNLFANTHEKINKQWQDRNAFQGYAKHVKDIAQQHNVVIHPDIWSTIQPTTSSNAHLILKAIECAYGQEKSVVLAEHFRQAFFEKAMDISHLEVLFDLAIEQGLQRQTIQAFIDNGQAIASLMSDYQQQQQLALQGSPSFVLDNARQILYGNVSFEVIKANVVAHISNDIT